MKRLITADEAGALLSVPSSWVLREARAGRVPHVRLGRYVRFDAGELIALRWRDVDWTAARIRVRQNYVLGEFGTPKSRRSTRSVPMADEVGGELERLYKQSCWQDDDHLVFANPTTGSPLDKSALRRRYRKALKAAKLDEAHLPSPAPHVRDAHGGGGRLYAHASGVDGPPGHRHNAALRRLRT